MESICKALKEKWVSFKGRKSKDHRGEGMEFDSALKHRTVLAEPCCALHSASCITAVPSVLPQGSLKHLVSG